MPPPMITNVTPTVITPMIEAEVRMVSRLLVVRKVSAVTTPTTPSSTSTATSPRLRPAPPSSSRAAGERAPVSRPARSTRCCSSTAGTSGTPAPPGSDLVRSVPSGMRCSFHDQVEDPGLVELGRRGLVHHPALAHDEHPVGQPEHLGHLAGHDHHRHPGRGQVADEAVDLAARADVDAAGRLVEQQHLAAAQQPPGQHDL